MLTSAILQNHLLHGWAFTRRPSHCKCTSAPSVSLLPEFTRARHVHTVDSVHSSSCLSAGWATRARKAQSRPTRCVLPASPRSVGPWRIAENAAVHRASRIFSDAAHPHTHV